MRAVAALAPRLQNLQAGLPDGFGGGGKLAFKQLTTEESKFSFGGIQRVDGDYEVGAEYEQVIATMEGRQIALSVEHEVDQNMPYYGIGDQTDVIGFVHEGIAKAYPLFILDRAEIVNDEFAGSPFGVYW